MQVGSTGTSVESLVTLQGAGNNRNEQAQLQAQENAQQTAQENTAQAIGNIGQNVNTTA